MTACLGCLGIAILRSNHGKLKLVLRKTGRRVNGWTQCQRGQEKKMIHRDMLPQKSSALESQPTTGRKHSPPPPSHFSVLGGHHHPWAGTPPPGSSSLGQSGHTAGHSKPGQHPGTSRRFQRAIAQQDGGDDGKNRKGVAMDTQAPQMFLQRVIQHHKVGHSRKLL